LKAHHLRKVNLIHHLCHAAFGPNHHPAIKYSAGGVIMILGVTVAKFAGEVHFLLAHYALDIIGYGIHGLGAVPFIERVIELMREVEDELPPLPPITFGDESGEAE
jgi:hypothetical protein